MCVDEITTLCREQFSSQQSMVVIHVNLMGSKTRAVSLQSNRQNTVPDGRSFLGAAGVQMLL